MVLTSLQDFLDLELNTKVYLCQPLKIVSYYYAGHIKVQQGKHGTTVNFVHGSSVSTVSSFYIPKEGRTNKRDAFVTDYEEAKKLATQMSEESLKSFKEIYSIKE